MRRARVESSGYSDSKGLDEEGFRSNKGSSSEPRVSVAKYPSGGRMHAL